MAAIKRFALTIIVLLFLCPLVDGQVDEMCSEFGFIATLDGPRLSAPFVFGRINIKANEQRAKFPKVTITYQNRGSSPERLTVGETGNYCFKVTSGAGGFLVVEVDGVEMARRQIATLAPAQQREDFEVFIDRDKPLAAPGVVSSKYDRPPNSKTVELYKRAVEAEEKKDVNGSIKLLKEIVAIDPEDFVAWGLLANKLLAKNEFAEAEAALRKAITLRADFVPAWITAGRVRTAQKQYEAAIPIFQHAAELDPENARVFQLLGESYLLTKKGSLGAEALNRAITLDPNGMAELHLQLAHLYQLAKANKLAADEYRKFLEKRPDHPDRKKFEKYIAEHLQK